MPKDARMLALPGTSEDLLQHTIGESWRVGEASSRSKVVVMRRGKGGRNAGIAGHNPAQRSSRELCGLQSGHDGLDLALRVVPGHTNFPTQTEIKRQVRLTFQDPDVEPAIARAGVQELHDCTG